MIALAGGQDKALPIITGHASTTQPARPDPKTAELIIAAPRGTVFEYPARAHPFG
jgi:hypothetical protein